MLQQGRGWRCLTRDGDPQDFVSVLLYLAPRPWERSRGPSKFQLATSVGDYHSSCVVWSWDDARVGNRKC